MNQTSQTNQTNQTSQPQNISRLSGQNLPTYIQESLHQAGLTHIPAGQAQAIAQHFAQGQVQNQVQNPEGR